MLTDTDTDQLTPALSYFALCSRVNELTWPRSATGRFELRFLCIDIDDFKSYLDQHGLPAGDAALIQLASALIEDYGAGNVYRFGDDEFVMLLSATPPVPLPKLPHLTLKYSVVSVAGTITRNRNHHVNSRILFAIHQGIIEATGAGRIIDVRIEPPAKSRGRV